MLAVHPGAHRRGRPAACAQRGGRAFRSRHVSRTPAGPALSVSPAGPAGVSSLGCVLVLRGDSPAPQVPSDTGSGAGSRVLVTLGYRELWPGADLNPDTCAPRTCLSGRVCGGAEAPPGRHRFSLEGGPIPSMTVVGVKLWHQIRIELGPAEPGSPWGDRSGTDAGVAAKALMWVRHKWGRRPRGRWGTRGGADRGRRGAELRAGGCPPWPAGQEHYESLINRGCNARPVGVRGWTAGSFPGQVISVSSKKYKNDVASFQVLKK